MVSTNLAIGAWAFTLFIISRFAGFIAGRKSRSGFWTDIIISSAIFIALLPTLPIFLGIVN
jgi:hypothetical protein